MYSKVIWIACIGICSLTSRKVGFILVTATVDLLTVAFWGCIDSMTKLLPESERGSDVHKNYIWWKYINVSKSSEYGITAGLECQKMEFKLAAYHLVTSFLKYP